MKPKLKINSYDLKKGYGTLGMPELLGILVDSDEFDVSFHKEHLDTAQGIRATTIYYNDKKIYLDFWEYTTPTYTNKVYNANFDLIIKLQHDQRSLKSFHHGCEKRGILKPLDSNERTIFFNKVVAWTFFCSRLMKQFVGKEDAFPKRPITQTGFFCGKSWKARRGMLRKFESENIEVIRSDQGLRKGKKLNDDQFLEKMLTSKYGIVIHGRHGIFADIKNRREIDYMMMKKPLLIDYEPHYYNPLINGVHYIHINKETDLNNLENMYNIDEIAENGYQWYKDNASPEGVVKVFRQIMMDRFNQ